MELKGKLSKVIKCVHTVTEVRDLSTKNKGVATCECKFASNCSLVRYNVKINS